MKTKYLFCAASLPIDSDTLFFDVWAGSSRRDEKDLLRVATIAQMSGFYFQKWSKDVQTFWDKICLSITPEESPQILSPHRLSVTVSELRRLLRAGTLPQFCTTYIQAFGALSRKGFSLNSAHLCAKNRACNILCNAVNVKNLSLQTNQL